LAEGVGTVPGKTYTAAQPHHELVFHTAIHVLCLNLL